MGVKHERSTKRVLYDYAQIAGKTAAALWHNKKLRQALFLVANTPKEERKQAVIRTAVKQFLPQLTNQQIDHHASQIEEYVKKAWATPAPTSSPTPPGTDGTKPTAKLRHPTPNPLEPPPNTKISTAERGSRGIAAAGTSRTTRIVEGVTPVSHFFSMASAKPRITQEKYPGMKTGSRLSTRVRHSELCGPLAPDHADTIQGTFYSNLRKITPANASLFPWLARYCVGQFAQYRINSIKFHSITDRPTSTAGVCFIFVDLDPADALLNSNVPDKEGLLDLRQVFSYPHSIVGSVYENHSLHLSGKDLAGSVGSGVYFLNSPVLDGKTWIDGWMPDREAENESSHTTVAGWVGFGTEGFSGYNNGYLMVEYDVSFFEPELEEREAWLSRNASLRCSTLPGTVADMLHIFGGSSATEPSTWSDQMQKVYQGADGIMRIWDTNTLLMQAPGLYDLSVRIHASTDTALLTPTFAVAEPKIDTGGAPYRYLGAGRSTVVNYEAGTAVLHNRIMVYTWRIYVESQTYVQWGVGGNGFWSGFSSSSGTASINEVIVEARRVEGQVYEAFWDAAMLDVIKP